MIAKAYKAKLLKKFFVGLRKEMEMKAVIVQKYMRGYSLKLRLKRIDENNKLKL